MRLLLLLLLLSAAILWLCKYVVCVLVFINNNCVPFRGGLIERERADELARNLDESTFLDHILRNPSSHRRKQHCDMCFKRIISDEKKLKQ